jgi:hypothetical protein
MLSTRPTKLLNDNVNWWLYWRSSLMSELRLHLHPVYIIDARMFVKVIPKAQ